MGFGPFDTEIHPLIAVIQPLDTSATEAAGGYDDELREPILTDSGDDGIGEPDTQYGPQFEIRVQVESDDQEVFNIGQGGTLPRTFITLSIFRQRLKSQGLLGTDGKPTFANGARLLKLKALNGETQWTYDRPDWLYLEEVRLADAHLAGKNNFFLTEWKSRQEGMTV